MLDYLSGCCTQTRRQTRLWERRQACERDRRVNYSILFPFRVFETCLFVSVWGQIKWKTTKKVDPFQRWFFVISDHYWTGLGWLKPFFALGVPFLANFFSSKCRHVGCPEWCHVMPGLSEFFSNARDPLRGSKRPKSQFYGHYGPHIPIFGTSFSADLFSLQNMGMWGVQSNAMWCLVLMQPFQTQGNPLRGSKRPKNQFYGHFGPQIPIFGCFELLSGSPGFAMWCLGLTQPFQTQGTQSVAHNGQKIGI